MLSLVFGGDWTRQVILALDSGKALNTFYEWIQAQGGQINKLSCNAKYHYKIVAKEEGYISSMNAEQIGRAAMLLGAGRSKVSDSIDYSAGIILKRKTGDYLNKGEMIAELLTNSETSLKSAENVFNGAITISNQYSCGKDLIYDIIK